MVLSLNWLPLGGFVKLRGEHDSDTRPGSFGAASLPAKARILLAGVGMNFLVGIVLLTILAFVGMPVLISKDYNGQTQFSVQSDTKVSRQQVEAIDILSGSPAAQIGLANRDTLISITANGQTTYLKTVSELKAATQKYAGQTVTIVYKHNGQTLSRTTKLLSTKEVAASHGQKGYLGVELNQLTIQRSTWSAPIVAVGLAGQFGWLTLQGLGHAFSGLGSAIAGLVTHNQQARENGQTQATAQVGGPVAIMEVLWGSGSLGINFVLALIALISLTLALMNILPIPALDGGRLAMVLVSRGILKRPLTKTQEEKIVGASMAVLLVLIALITIVDIKRFF